MQTGVIAAATLSSQVITHDVIVENKPLAKDIIGKHYLAQHSYLYIIYKPP